MKTSTFWIHFQKFSFLLTRFLSKLQMKSSSITKKFIQSLLITLRRKSRIVFQLKRIWTEAKEQDRMTCFADWWEKTSLIYLIWTWLTKENRSIKRSFKSSKETSRKSKKWQTPNCQSTSNYYKSTIISRRMEWLRPVNRSNLWRHNKPRYNSLWVKNVKRSWRQFKIKTLKRTKK